jgi:hypothetical protein
MHPFQAIVSTSESQQNIQRRIAPTTTTINQQQSTGNIAANTAIVEKPASKDGVSTEDFVSQRTFYGQEGVNSQCNHCQQHTEDYC